MLEGEIVLQLMHQSQRRCTNRALNPENGQSELKLRISGLRSSIHRNDLSDYQFRETLGAGGFGTVKKAVHLPTGVEVAVKICAVENDKELLQCIEKEIQLQRRVLHSGIAQIYEVIRLEGKVFIVMELCQNGELFELINKDGAMPEKEAAKVFQQVLSALLYLKSGGLSHRDIKPENILFNDQWNAKLIDFGFGCDSPSRFHRTVCGTPSYTPPEIIRRQAYDAELVDVWSLGVTLYAMLAGELPFEGEDFEQRKKNILSLKYRPQSCFSSKAQKLFASIFVEAKYRPRLSDLQSSEFSLAYDGWTESFVDLKHDIPEVEERVIEVIEGRHRISRSAITQSVRCCHLDRNRALYYLTLKSIKDSNLNLYRKRKRSSLIKLDAITRTPSLSKEKSHEHRTPNKHALHLFRFPQRQPKLNLPTPRLIIDSQRPSLRVTPRRPLNELENTQQCS